MGAGNGVPGGRESGANGPSCPQPGGAAQAGVDAVPTGSIAQGWGQVDAPARWVGHRLPPPAPRRPLKCNCPESLGGKVDFADIAAAASALQDALKTGPKDYEGLRRYGDERYSLAQMVTGYAHVILNATKLEPLQDRYDSNVPHGAVVSIPAWCSITNSGYFDDYLGDYVRDPELLQVIRTQDFPLAASELQLSGVSSNALDEWVRDGLLTWRHKQHADHRPGDVDL